MKFFTEVLYDTEHGVLEFHFERIGSSSTTGYQVVLIADIIRTYRFTMQKEEDVWRIIDKSSLPLWVAKFETVLSDSICAHLMRTIV